jgi:glycerol-3-phosphate acyltransferase PlsX
MSSNNNSKCIIALDAMGGDFAPRNTVQGAVDAIEADSSFELLLVGDKEKILIDIKENNLSFNEKNIVHAEEVIEMNDSPTGSLKSKPNSSIVVGAKLVRQNKAHAFVSAGNTGAMMAASTLLTGRIKGVSRPTIGASFPTVDGGICNVFDVGSSVDSKANHLFEYAVMGSIFVEEVQGRKNPTIGLMSVGEEEEKGNEVSKEAYKLLKDSDLNFIGNVEGRDVLNGSVDIVICDGFVGNIILKFAESVIGFLKGRFRNYADESIGNKVKVLMSRGTLKGALKGMDYQEHGGVPLLGINGISIIGHGSSSPLAIKNMVLKAKEMYDKNLIEKIEKSLNSYTGEKHG